MQKDWTCFESGILGFWSNFGSVQVVVASVFLGKSGYYRYSGHGHAAMILRTSLWKWQNLSEFLTVPIRRSFAHYIEHWVIELILT